MTLDTRARRAAAVVALLGTGALGVGTLAAASPALAASAKPAAGAKAPKPADAVATPKASPTPKTSPTQKASPAPKASAKPGAAAPAVITVAGLSSAFGSTAGGTNVVINGKGFSRVDPANKSAVLFGKAPATTFLVLSDTQIAATVPAGSGTKVPVSVTDGTDTSPDTAGDDFTYLDPISVQVPDKTDLSAAGGTKVRLTLAGTNLSLGTSQGTFAQKKITATVDGTPGALTWVDATHVDLTAPAGTPTRTGGKVSVVVVNNGVAGPADTTHARYVAVVTKLSVATGRTTGTTGAAGKPALTITGVGLNGATGFSFGSVKGTCTAVSGKEATTWTCANVPAGTVGAVPVLPTFTDGRSAGVTAGSIFVYTDL
ncbi:IPT/TIG domain-containing protein [Cryptosporangium arvum]|uniref:IPT/TIG domain-containing protein n=1 Tax=Cryptosporangium arvum TaxID=80871 RepID=UPI0004AE5525|nr:IPT/TIG domain-containing protein [Cryptosporangium arvum]